MEAVHMAAYVIVNVDIRDPERYRAYMREAPRIIQKHGGEYLVRGGQVEVMEGTWKPHRLVLLRFPDVQAARALLSDPEYLPLKAIRHECAQTDIVAVEGIEGK
jgi:uncharacterized protein (DUF1330 family)